MKKRLVKKGLWIVLVIGILFLTFLTATQWDKITSTDFIQNKIFITDNNMLSIDNKMFTH